MREKNARPFLYLVDPSLKDLEIDIQKPVTTVGGKPAYLDKDLVALVGVRGKLAYTVNLQTTAMGPCPVELGPRLVDDPKAYLEGSAYSSLVSRSRRDFDPPPLVGSYYDGTNWYGQFWAPGTDQRQYGSWQAGWSAHGSALGAIHASIKPYLSSLPENEGEEDYWSKFVAEAL